MKIEHIDNAGSSIGFDVSAAAAGTYPCMCAPQTGPAPRAGTPSR
jgi:hypothetical protein